LAAPTFSGATTTCVRVADGLGDERLERGLVERGTAGDLVRGRVDVCPDVVEQVVLGHRVAEDEVERPAPAQLPRDVALERLDVREVAQADVCRGGAVRIELDGDDRARSLRHHGRRLAEGGAHLGDVPPGCQRP
jgi:hypothetical protein